MFTANLFLLACTLVLSGGYAGLVLMSHIGVAPAMRRLTLPAYIDFFRAIDYWMGRRMPPYKISLLLFSIATIVTSALAHRTTLAWCVAGSLALNLIDLILNVSVQLPFNKRICESPADTPASTLQAFLERTATFFAIRFFLSFPAFALLCFGTVFTLAH